ncbi:MAG TPA: hypothetical protein VF337_11610, partial [Candidatus Limnocylindrales bacterium]
MPAGDGSVVALDLFAAAAPAVVEVAVDAPGASRTYDYSVPDRLGPVLPGEAVLVEFGRQRQALGIILGPSANVAGAVLKPLLARVHADGPLVPPLTLAFARWIASEYMAPPAATLRSMLPPGMLERLELVAELAPGPARAAAESTAAGPAAAEPAAGPGDAEESAVIERLAEGPRPVRDLEGGDGRAATLRRLRAMAARGLVRLEWTLTAASAGPRYERWLTLSDEGRAVVLSPARNAVPGGARLGPRQRAL